MSCRGVGLFVKNRQPPHKFIIEYVGDVISEEERIKRLGVSDRRNCYVMDVGQGLFLDAEKSGSEARYINHSCAPNCEAQKWQDDTGKTRIAIYTLCEVSAGAELTYDYQYVSHCGGSFKCLCGAASCRGQIGTPPSTHAATAGGPGDALADAADASETEAEPLASSPPAVAAKGAASTAPEPPSGAAGTLSGAAEPPAGAASLYSAEPPAAGTATRLFALANARVAQQQSVSDRSDVNNAQKVRKLPRLSSGAR